MSNVEGIGFLFSTPLLLSTLSETFPAFLLVEGSTPDFNKRKRRKKGKKNSRISSSLRITYTHFIIRHSLFDIRYSFTWFLVPCSSVLRKSSSSSRHLSHLSTAPRGCEFISDLIAGYKIFSCFGFFADIDEELDHTIQFARAFGALIFEAENIFHEQFHLLLQ
jgi:hypothetical protein